MTSGIGYEWMDDVNHTPYSGQEGFLENLKPFAYIPRSKNPPPPPATPPKDSYQPYASFFHDNSENNGNLDNYMFS